MRKEEIKELVHNFPDRSIKWLLETPDNLRGLLTIAVGDLSKKINYSQIEKIDKTFILENFRKLEADMVFKAPFEDTSEEPPCEVIIYILIEHQSTVDQMMPFRILSYMVQIWEMQRKEWENKDIPQSERLLYPILPVVFYTGNQIWDKPIEMRKLMRLSSSLESVIPHFEIFFLNLKTTGPMLLSKGNYPFSQVLKIIQKETVIVDEFEEILIQSITQLDNMPFEEQANWQKLVYFIYMFICNRRERSEQSDLINILENAVKNKLRREEVKKMGKTIAQSWIEEGMEKGVEKGMRDSLQQILIETLEIKFESVPPNMAKSINSIKKPEILKALHHSAIKCDTIDEFGDKMKTIIKGVQVKDKKLGRK